MISQLFLSMLEVSLTTGIGIVIIKILSLFINKNYAAKWIKLIWLMVAVRLLLPINFSPFGAPVQLSFLSSSNANNISYTASSDINADMVDETAIEGFKDTEVNTGIQDNRLIVRTGDSLNKTIPWMNIAVFIWGTGCVLFIMYHLIGYLYYRKQILRWSRADKEQRIHNIIAEVSQQLSLQKQLKVYVCDKIASPSLMGFIHPVLVIPPDCYSDKEMSLIIKHELTHHRLKDIWYKLFLIVVNAVHWFNPAVYLLRHEAYIDLEVACDDEVIKSMSVDDRKKYGETILSCINQQKIRKVALTTGFNDTAKTLKDRLKNILSAEKKRNGLIIIFISLILVVGIGALISFGGEKKKHRDTDGHIWYGAVSLIPENTKLPDNLIENSDQLNEFLESDRTIALVANIPEEDIYVYGLKELGREEGTYTLHGICVKQGSEVQVLDINWGVYDELPKLRYQDYDGDGIKELAMISRSESGMDISLNDLYILEKRKEGGWTPHSFASSDWQNIINKRMEYQEKDGILTISIDGKDTGYRINIASLEEEWGEELTSVFFGSYGEFYFSNERIFLKVLPAAKVGNWVTPQIITDNYIPMEVLYKGNFDLINGFDSQPIRQEASDNNADSEGDTKIEEMKIEDVAEDSIQEYLDSPEGKLLKERSDSFVKAYFSNDKEAALAYLAEDADYDSCVYRDDDGKEVNVYNKLIHILAKWYTASDDKKANVQYEYELEDEDSFTYLNLDLVREEDNWVIFSIYLEK